MMTIAIANQKGGCGKTTTAINLAACLGQRQQRVLLIDMDPQGHASLGLGLQCEDKQGLYEVLMRETEINDVIIPDVSRGVDMVPATISLAAVEQLLADFYKKDQQLLLHLEGVADNYDFTIIDCPPQLGILSFNALRAADQLIVPLEMSSFALDGLARLFDTITLLREQFSTDIPVCILPTMVDYRTRFTSIIMDEIRERFRDEVIAAPVHYTVRIKEAAYHGKAIIDYEPDSPAANDYWLLCEAILAGRSPALAVTQQRFDHLNKTAEPPEINPVPARDLSHDKSLDIPAPSNILSANNDEDTQTVILQFNDTDIRTLQIAGEFNNWIPDANVVTRREDGIIKKILQIQPGQYQYRLIINGKWQKDANNPQQTPNEYGETNSLLEVPAAAQATA